MYETSLGRDPAGGTSYYSQKRAEVQGSGFARRRPREFAQFLRYALASLSETKTRLVDGVDRRHFTRADIGQALMFGVRCTDATRALHASQVRFIEGDPRGATGRRRPRL